MLNNCYSCSDRKGHPENIPLDDLVLKSIQGKQQSNSMKFSMKNHHGNHDHPTPNRIQTHQSTSGFQKQEVQRPNYKLTDYPMAPRFNYPENAKHYEYPTMKIATDSRIEYNYGHSRASEPITSNGHFCGVPFREQVPVSTNSQISYFDPSNNHAKEFHFVPVTRFRQEAQVNPESQYFKKPVQKGMRIRTQEDLFPLSASGVVDSGSRISCEAQISSNSQVTIPNVVSTDSRIVYGHQVPNAMNSNHRKTGNFPMKASDTMSHHQSNIRIRQPQEPQRNRNGSLIHHLDERALAPSASENDVVHLLREENARLHKIIDHSYLPMKKKYEKMVHQQEEREYLISMLEWKIKELSKQLIG